MRRLRSGLRVVMELDRAVVVDVALGPIRDVSIDDGAALVALAAGDQTATARLVPGRDDVLESRSDPVDPSVLPRLAALDGVLVGDAPKDDRAAAVLALLERAHARRGWLDLALGQRPALPETALRRALLPEARADAVLVLGDDDFTAVALAALHTGRVTVHDVDPHLLRVASEVLREAGLEAELLDHDVREPLPEGARGAFGAVHVTLPHGGEGARLVLSRAVSCLAPGGVIIASTSATGLPALDPLLREVGLRLERHVPGFHRYYTPECRLDPEPRDLVCLRGESPVAAIPHDRRFLPDRLYAPDAPPHAPVLSYTLEAIEDARYTHARFMSLLLDRVPGLAPGLMTDAGAVTGFATLLADEGFVLVHADRDRRALQAVVAPLGAAPQKTLLALLHAAHKPGAEGLDITGDTVCVVARAR